MLCQFRTVQTVQTVRYFLSFQVCSSCVCSRIFYSLVICYSFAQFHSRTRLMSLRFVNFRNLIVRRIANHISINFACPDRTFIAYCSSYLSSAIAPPTGFLLKKLGTLKLRPAISLTAISKCAKRSNPSVKPALFLGLQRFRFIYSSMIDDLYACVISFRMGRIRIFPISKLLPTVPLR